MEQIILHLIGDYITQTSWMATEKTKRMWPAFVHALVYAMPFWLLTSSAHAMWVICSTHFVIDHFRVARYVVFAKNWITQPSLRWADCSTTGYHKDTQPWLAFWLLIIADNTIHLAINYVAIRWL
jgi:multidrug transporter EmrE-like cation transporter